jgi:serine/threonine-protein kinase
MRDGLAAMLKEGEVIGSYRIRQRLGAGGMGEVFLAEHRHIERKAAIKVLLPELSTKEEVVARFFTEARSASRIKHPGIVEVIDCEIDQRGRAFIVMEFLDGESLAHCLQRAGRLDVNSSLGIVGQIASALSAAHPKGIIHRDLKPDNVFLVSTPDAETPLSVKILDFGIAKLVAHEGVETGRTQTGSLLGTPLYMSPEQCRGSGRIDHRTDIYSLGCMLFEMLAGRPPFIREGAGELIAAHLSEAPPDILSLQPSLRPDLGHLVMRLLAKEPDTRPQTMLEVVHAVESILGLPAAQFLRAIYPREGFPPPADSLPPIEGAPVRPGDFNSPINPVVERTRLLPQEPSAKVTTFSNTASEIAGSWPPPRRRRSLGWLVAAASGVAAIGIVVFASRLQTVAVRPGASPREQGAGASQPVNPSPPSRVKQQPPPPPEPPSPPPRELAAQPVVTPQEIEPPTAQKTDSPTSSRKRPPRKRKPADSPREDQDPYTLIKE